MPTKKTSAAAKAVTQVGRRPMPKKTDALRRLAMQIAVQLPDSVSDADIVLELVRDLLHRFMIDARKARRTNH